MRIFFSIVLAILFNIPSFAQNIALANEKLNVAYAGIPNPITIVVEGYKPNQISVSTDNGTLVDKGNGHYDYTPLKEGKAILKITTKTKKGMKEIGESVYRIKWIPKPIAKLPGQGGHFPYLIKVSGGVILTLTDFDFEVHFKVVDYKFEIERNGQIIFTTFNIGAKFGDAIKVGIDKMKAEDRIFISEIHYSDPIGRIGLTNSIVYTYR